MQNRPWLKIVIGVVVLAVLAATAGPFIYIHFIKDDAPKKLSIDSASVESTSDSATNSLPVVSAPAGGPITFSVTPDSQVGYRVVEVLFGQDAEGVGRTNAVTGSVTLDGASVTAADFTVDMTTLKSDEDNRDRKFKGEIMDTTTFPTASFRITQPIDLGSAPADGVETTATATGDLTLHGVARSITVDVTAKRTGSRIAIVGSTDVRFADYDIVNPSNGAVTTQDHGLIEFLLVATA